MVADNALATAGNSKANADNANAGDVSSSGSGSGGGGGGGDLLSALGALLDELVQIDFADVMSDRYGAHVVATLVRVLGGERCAYAKITSASSSAAKKKKKKSKKKKSAGAGGDDGDAGNGSGGGGGAVDEILARKLAIKYYETPEEWKIEWQKLLDWILKQSRGKV